MLSLPVLPAAPDFSTLDIKIGNVRIPRNFIHSGKDYNRGIYYVTLTNNKGVPYFNVYNPKKELLFEEMAVLVLRNYKGKAKKLRHWIRKGLLRGNEYYRIRVTRADSHIMAFLLINSTKKAAKKGVKKDAKKGKPAAANKKAATKTKKKSPVIN
jgi:hypothetical protein